VKPADLTLWIRKTVTTLHNQLASFAGQTDRGFGRFQSTSPSKRQAAGLVFDASRQPSTMKRSPVPERAASSVWVQPRPLRFSLTAVPKSRAVLNIQHLKTVTDREARRFETLIDPDREVFSSKQNTNSR
jgi:hypothetical protein